MFDRASEGGDCMQNKELHAVILTDFQFCCQVSNAFSPSVTQRCQTPQLRWVPCFIKEDITWRSSFQANKFICCLTARIPQRHC